MAGAYQYAEGGQPSPEIKLLNLIKRFGVPAILNRQFLYMDELYQMQIAEAVVNAYRSRERSENWVAWQTENPELMKLLVEAQKLSNG